MWKTKKFKKCTVYFIIYYLNVIQSRLLAKYKCGIVLIHIFEDLSTLAYYYIYFKSKERYIKSLTCITKEKNVFQLH